jgi:hypothetical protein
VPTTSRLARLKLAALVVLVVLTGSACTAQPNGELVQWPAMAEPAAWRPVMGACHNQFASREATAEGECSAPHKYQTVFVGEITGAVAAANKPPITNAAVDKKLWTECDARLSAFLGGPWHERKLRLMVAFPSTGAWEGGARWYSCEAGLWDITEDWLEATWSAGLEHGFDSLELLRFGCYHAPANAKVRASSCTEAHNTEFAGTFQYGDMSYADLTVQRGSGIGNPVDGKCREVVAAFAGAPRVRTGTWVWDPAQDWDAGDRTMRCFLWLGEVTVAKSLRGAGASGWPIRS